MLIKGVEAGRSKRTYTAMEQHWVVARAFLVGLSAASQETGISKTTLADWMKRRELRQLAERYIGSRVALSRRELEVVDLVQEGLTYAEVAERLGTAQRTVESQALGIRRKLAAPTGRPLREAKVERPRAAPLSQREADVLADIVNGLSNGQIAEMHGVTKKVIENHIGVLFQKTGARHRAELAFYAGIHPPSRKGGGRWRVIPGKPPVIDPE